MLAMTVAAAIVLTTALLEDDFLIVAELADDLSGYRGVRHARRADLGAEHQHLVEDDLGAGVPGQLFNSDHVVLGDAILFAAGLDYCEHSRKTLERSEKSGLPPKAPAWEPR